MLYNDALCRLHTLAWPREAWNEFCAALPEIDGALLFDIDTMTATNQTVGYQAGDQLIRRTASRIRASVPQNFPVLRSGGDEFLTLFHTTSYPKNRWVELRDSLDDRSVQIAQNFTDVRYFSVSCAFTPLTTLDSLKTLHHLLEVLNEAIATAKTHQSIGKYARQGVISIGNAGKGDRFISQPQRSL